MTIWQGLILNGREVVNAPLVVGNTVFDTNDGRITFGHELYAASTQLGVDTTNAQMVLGLGTALGNQLVIGSNAVMGNDYDHVPQTNPTLYIQSAINPNTDNTQWLSLTHNQVDGSIVSGFGCVRIGPTVGVDTLSDFTIFPGAKFIATQAATGHWYLGTIGVIGEAVAPAAPSVNLGTGVGGVASTNGANNGRGVCGVGKVTNTADTADSIGVYARALDTHAGGRNIGVMGNATDGQSNYSFYGMNGELYNNGGITGTLLSTFVGANSFAGLYPYAADGCHLWVNQTNGVANNNVILTTFANYAKNHDHTPGNAHPTFYLQSAVDPDVDNTQWGCIRHIGTEMQVQTGVGGVVFYPASGVTHFNNYCSVTSGFLGRDNSGLYFGTAASVCGLYDAFTDTAVHSLKVGVAQATSNILMLCQFNHIGSNPAIAAQTNPTLIVQSANAPAAQPTENVRIAHNQTNGVITVAKGDLILDPVSEVTEVCGVGLKTKEYNATVNDEATISLPASTTGWGTIMIGDNQEFARFRWTAAAVPTLDESTANVVTSDTDGNLCIFDGGTSISIRNRLGANLVVRYVVHYS